MFRLRLYPFVTRLLLTAAVGGLLYGCAGLQSRIIDEAGRQSQVVVFTPEQTQRIRTMLAGQVLCGEGQTAVIAAIKDRDDKITATVRCE
jgi:hypothetical protein